MTGDVVGKSLSDTLQASTDVVKTTVKITEAGIKKAWSVLDAASEKKSPTEYLSSNAVKAIQGIGHST